MRLFRPVGQAELDLIEGSYNTRFPPRLPIQPIFYPVLTFEYARKIAEGWNTKDAASGYVGYITEFDIDDTFIQGYEVQQAGGRDCEEYWIPADELETFNDNIIGPIRVIATYTADKQL